MQFDILIVICMAIALISVILLFKQIIPPDLAFIVVMLSLVSFVVFYQIGYTNQQLKEKQKTVKKIDSALTKSKSAKVLLEPSLCETVRKHYVRQFESTAVVKGSDCGSGLLVVTKNQTERK